MTVPMFPFYTSMTRTGRTGARTSPIGRWRSSAITTGTRQISKEDIFYYTYALLHHPEYRERYGDNMKRELPRLPFAPDFWAFAEPGRSLAALHLDYETVTPYPLKQVYSADVREPDVWHVTKMRLDKSAGSVKVNDMLTLTGIPAEAHEYRLGNRSALEWVIDQYRVKTKNGTTSDPNRYSDDPRYIVDLVGRVVQVSVETVRIVNALAESSYR